MLIDRKLVQVDCHNIQLPRDKEIQLEVHNHCDASLETICKIADEIVALAELDGVNGGHDRTCKGHRD